MHILFQKLHWLYLWSISFRYFQLVFFSKRTVFCIIVSYAGFFLLNSVETSITKHRIFIKKPFEAMYYTSGMFICDIHSFHLSSLVEPCCGWLAGWHRSHEKWMYAMFRCSIHIEHGFIFIRAQCTSVLLIPVAAEKKTGKMG